MQLLICRPVGWIEGYSVAEDEEDEALEQAVFGPGDGHSETGTLSANPAHSSLNDRMVIEWVHEDDCLVTALTCTAFRDFVRDIHKKRKEMKGSTQSGRITTLSAGVVSSLDRFLWVRSSFPGEKAPQWLNRWDGRTCYYIAMHGPLVVLQWAREHGCQWDYRACYGAARGGQMDVLQYLRVNGCPWDSNTCMGAAEGGHLDVLRWLRAHGCPWDEDTPLARARALGASTCSMAAKGGHMEV